VRKGTGIRVVSHQYPVQASFPESDEQSLHALVRAWTCRCITTLHDTAKHSGGAGAAFDQVNLPTVTALSGRLTEQIENERKYLQDKGQKASDEDNHFVHHGTGNALQPRTRRCNAARRQKVFVS